MPSTGRIVFFVLSACCALPFLEAVFVTRDLTLWKALVAVGGGGGLVALYQIVSALRSDESGEALRKTSDAIDQRVQVLSREVATLRAQAAALALDTSTRLDSSEAGLAWKRIHTLTKDAPYRQFIADHPGAPYVDEANKRREAIGRWQVVDRADPFDVHFFILSGPFEALRIEAEAAMPAAVHVAQREHRGEFWRQVAIPFYVFAPLMFGVYVVAFAILTGIYATADHPTIAGALGTVESAVTTAVEKWLPALPEGIRHIWRNVLPNLSLIVRLAYTAVTVITVFMALQAVLAALWRELIQPRIDALERELNKASGDEYWAVWHG